MMLLLFYGFLILGSCKKLDTSQEQNEAVANSYEGQFFNSHRTNDSKENAIVNFVKRINEKENFVNNAIKQIGFPRWDKITYYASKYNSNSFTSSNDSTTTYYIPFVRDSQNFVNASLIIVANPTDTTFQFKYDWQYLQMQNTPNSLLDSAENFAILFMRLDKAVFGYKKFSITDHNLFKRNNKHAIHVELGDSATQDNLNAQVTCTTVTITYNDCYAPDSDKCRNGCDGCWWCTAVIHITSCIENGGSGGSEGGSGIPTGSGPSGTPSNGGCGTCGGGSGTGWTGWSNLPLIPITTVFCDSVNAIAQNANFRTLFQNLKNQVPTRKENMYIIPKNLSQTPTLYSGQENAFEINPLPADTALANGRGWIHNHFADADSAGLIFSAGDIAEFAYELTNTSTFNQDYKTFMIGVVSDSSQYILSVSDFDKFTTWANTFGNESIISSFYTQNNLSQGFLPISVAETEKRF